MYLPAISPHGYIAPNAFSKVNSSKWGDVWDNSLYFTRAFSSRFFSFRTLPVALCFLFEESENIKKVL